MSNHLSIIVPVYNEAATIVSVMREVSKVLPEAQIIYVDDGSKDASLNLLRAHARPNDIVVTKKNGGKGSAIRFGLEYVQRPWCVIQDADLEYEPSEIIDLLECARNHQDTIVFGSRFLRPNPNIYPLYLLGNKVLTMFANILFWSHLTDAYTCYKLFPTEILKKIPLKANGFELEAELTAYPLVMGKTIKEVPITYRPRTFEEGKKINSSDAWKGLWTMVRIWWKKNEYQR